MATQYEAIQSHIAKLKDNIYTSLPAKVTSVNTEGGVIKSVDVKPSVGRRYSDGDKRSRSTLQQVPVVFPSAGGGILSFPVSVGDTVLLVFAQADLDNFLLSESELPRTMRQFSINDPVAICGLYPFQNNLNPSSSDVELKFNGNSIVLKSDGSIQVVTGSTVSVRNESEELVSLLSELISTLENTTVNTVYGASPLNSKTSLATLKTRLDTFKE